MSKIFVDRDGYEWPKTCGTCDKLESYSKRKDDKTTCTAYNKHILEEPVKSLYNKGEGIECSYYFNSGD